MWQRVSSTPCAPHACLMRAYVCSAPAQPWPRMPHRCSLLNFAPHLCHSGSTGSPLSHEIKLLHKLVVLPFSDARALCPPHPHLRHATHVPALWHACMQGVLASGGDDKVVMLWRIDPDAAPGLDARGGTMCRKSTGASPKVHMANKSRFIYLVYIYCPGSPLAYRSKFIHPDLGFKLQRWARLICVGVSCLLPAPSPRNALCPYCCPAPPFLDPDSSLLPVLAPYSSITL